MLAERPVHGSDEIHTSLLLLKGNVVQDKIHFDNVKSRLCLVDVGTCVGKKSKEKEGFYQLYFIGNRQCVGSLWEELKDKSKKIDGRYFFNRHEFNCRAGVAGTLKGAGLAYILPEGMEARAGMSPDFSKAEYLVA